MYRPEVHVTKVFSSDLEDPLDVKSVKLKDFVKKVPRSSGQSSAIAKLMVSYKKSNFSIPTPTINNLSVELGEEDNFGEGVGSEFGFSFGKTAEFEFIVPGGSANDVVLVIDWSESMDDVKGRFELLQEEMKKVFESIPNGSRMQVILFCGTYWLASDINDPDRIKGGGRGVFETQDRESGVVYTYRGGTQLSPNAKRVAEWTKMSDAYQKQLMDFTEKGQLGLGTSWEGPLVMALEMQPAPKTIIFLTDGITKDAKGTVERVSKLAQKKGTVIKTIAMMEPKAEKGMRDLAEHTGGSFTLVEGLSKEQRETTHYTKN